MQTGTIIGGGGWVPDGKIVLSTLPSREPPKVMIEDEPGQFTSNTEYDPYSDIRKMLDKFGATYNPGVVWMNASTYRNLMDGVGEARVRRAATRIARREARVRRRRARRSKH